MSITNMFQYICHMQKETALCIKIAIVTMRSKLIVTFLYLEDYSLLGYNAMWSR
jgi:hypothetical protein